MALELKEIAIGLLMERVPLGYDPVEARVTARKGIPQFIEDDEWARGLAGKIEVKDLERLTDHLVVWFKDRNYPLLNRDLPPYGMPKPKDLGPWAPTK